jgi:hypothetical protein
MIKKGSIGLELPKLILNSEVKLPALWPYYVCYYNGICYWDNQKSYCVKFGHPVSNLVELFRVPLGHPAYGSESGLGVRATSHIGVGVTIGYYAGEMYPLSFTDKLDIDSNYLMEPSTHSKFVYDGKYVSNEMRFINDPRGIADLPNVKMGKRKQRRHEFKGHSFRISGRPIVTTRQISAGEEVLLDYGDAYWSAQGKNDDYSTCFKCSRILDTESNFSLKTNGERARTCKNCAASKKAKFAVAEAPTSVIRAADQAPLAPVAAVVPTSVVSTQAPVAAVAPTSVVSTQAPVAAVAVAPTSVVSTQAPVAPVAVAPTSAIRAAAQAPVAAVAPTSVVSTQAPVAPVAVDPTSVIRAAVAAAAAVVEQLVADPAFAALALPPQIAAAQASVSAPSVAPASAPALHLIGSLKELAMDSFDFDNYRTSFMPVTVICFQPDEAQYLVGSYVEDHPLTWVVSRSDLFDPRGPEMVRTFAIMDNVEVKDHNGIWWGAIILSEVDATHYSVLFKVSFDGFSKIETVQKYRIRSATVVLGKHPNNGVLHPDQLEKPNNGVLHSDQLEKPNNGVLHPDQLEKPNNGVLHPDQLEKPNNGVLHPDQLEKPNNGVLHPDQLEKPNNGVLHPDQLEKPNNGVLHPDQLEKPNNGELHPDQLEEPNNGVLHPDQLEKPMRICRVCKTEFPLTKEHFYKISDTGFRKKCKKCFLAYNAKRRKI